MNTSDYYRYPHIDKCDKENFVDCDTNWYAA